VFEIGNSLREARLRQGVDLVEAESSTKIRTKYLRALEEERFELLPAQTYVKGFLRSYAEYLGLDGQLYVDEFNSRYVTGEEEPPIRARRNVAAARAQRRVESSVLLVALAGIATATALVFVAWKWGGADPGAIPNLETQPPAETAIAPAETEPAKRPARQQSAPQRRPVVIELLATATVGDCWVSVHRGSATGPILYEGTIEQGKSQRFPRAKRLWLNVGAPQNLRVTLNGKRVDVPGVGPTVLVATPKGLTRDRTT